MAGLYASALLDELMGRNRDANPNDKRRDVHWSDPEVCIISSAGCYDIVCRRSKRTPVFDDPWLFVKMNRTSQERDSYHSSCTSNVTGRHRGPKRKLRAGYRASSLKRTSCCDGFLSSSVVSRAFSELCVYSTFGHHPHPLGYSFAKFRFFRGLHCWATVPRREKSHTQSLSHSFCHSPSLFDVLGTEAFASE